MKRVFSGLLILVSLLMPMTSYADEAAKEATYQRALEFLNSGEYDMAISIFEMLGDYSDSAAQILICENAKTQIYYDRACELFNAGEYDAAKEIFLMLGSFSDSQVQAVRCDTQKKQAQYDAANALVESGNYEQAREAFVLLGEFSDSAARVEQMDQMILAKQYERAQSLEVEGAYTQAIAIYEELGGYEDSAGRMKACEQQIHISELSGKIESALSAGEFKAEVVYPLLKEGTTYGLEPSYLATAFAEAIDQETRMLYGDAPVYVDVDMNGDGITERILSSNGQMIVAGKTENGLSVVSSLQAPAYSELICISDPSQRTYLQAMNGDQSSYDVYLVEDTPVLINTNGSIASTAALEMTASGFILNEVLTADPIRQRQTEYIVLSGTEVVVNQLPLYVDGSTYPAVHSAGLLIRLYRDAVQYESETELKALLSEDANGEQLELLNQWLFDHATIERTDTILWDEAGGFLVGLIASGNDTIYITMRISSEGNYSLLGLY